MTTLNKQFVPYTLALKLKELGFDEPCMAVIDQTEYIHIKGTKYPIRGAMVYSEINCPLWKQVWEWFREKHGLFIYIHLYRTDMAGNPLEFEYYYRIPKKLKSATVRNFNTYEEAQNACLENIIKWKIEDGNR